MSSARLDFCWVGVGGGVEEDDCGLRAKESFSAGSSLQQELSYIIVCLSYLFSAHGGVCGRALGDNVGQTVGQIHRLLQQQSEILSVIY